VKKYRFNLDAVLRVRRIEEERAAAALAAGNRAMAESEAELERRLDHYRGIPLPTAALEHARYLAARQQLAHAADGVVIAGTARLAAEAEVDRLRALWAAAAARVKALERLDERRREEHAGEVRREEVLVLDEVAAAIRVGSR
jgi:flagellar FliJ protein